MNESLFFLSAFVLGALHALEPGHGKTVVAAYLVGSKGRVQDAFLLGGVVTFTHTFSIILLGVLTAVASAYLVPETVHEVLEVVSGLLITGVGIWMIRDRILLARPGNHHHEMNHSHGEHHHEPEESLVAGHGHAHHDHGHDHAHHHSHSHAPSPGDRPGLGGLITLGISGGMVPCPAALALLLAAVAVGNVLGGVALVVVFSLGLAAVLIAIGVALVKAAHLAARYLDEGAGGEGRLARRAGAASAIVVTALGLLMTARAILDVTGIQLFA